MQIYCLLALTIRYSVFLSEFQFSWILVYDLGESPNFGDTGNITHSIICKRRRWLASLSSSSSSGIVCYAIHARWIIRRTEEASSVSRRLSSWKDRERDRDRSLLSRNSSSIGSTFLRLAKLFLVTVSSPETASLCIRK